MPRIQTKRASDDPPHKDRAGTAKAICTASASIAGVVVSILTAAALGGVGWELATLGIVAVCFICGLMIYMVSKM